MDLLMSVVSIMKDMNSVDKEYKNLNLQLKYTLDKASRILNKIDKDSDKLGLVVLKTRMKEGEQLSKKLDDLLNTESIAIKDKIRLSLPFSQTKTQIIDVIETLERVINDLKQEISDGAINQMKVENKEGGVKRKISDSNIIISNTIKPIKNQLTLQQIDQHIEEMYEMGPTLKDDQYQISESKHKQRELEFKVSIHGSAEILKILEGEDLAESKTKINQQNVPQELVIYTVARIKFQKCYAKIKALTKDIDRISTKAHFHFVFQKLGQVKIPSQFSRTSSNLKKSTKERMSQTQKQQEDVFFSFPQDEKACHNFDFRVIVKKEDENKTLYRVSNDEWIKVEQAEFEILDGDKLAAFLSPDTKEPSIYFQINYSLAH